MRGFALGLRQDLAPHGIGVSTVFPGFIRDAGMFATSGTVLPRYIGTNTSEEVAAAVVRAIERDRAEVHVAPLGMSVGAILAGLAPALAARVQRLAGADRMSSELTDAQARARARPGAGEEPRS
jgi:short-subunit dehydrogenase